MRRFVLLLGTGLMLLWSVNVFALPWLYAPQSDGPAFSEPASMLLLGTGLLCIASLVRNRPTGKK